MAADFRKVTLDQMRAFVLVAEQGNFTSAAQMKMRTQTAVTRQIKNIEEALGDRLVLRTRGHVQGLTEAGLRFLPLAQKVVRTFDGALASFRSPTVSGGICVGIMDDIDAGWLNGVVCRFRKNYPKCDVRAVSDFSFRLECRLEKGEIDVAIIKRLVPAERSEGEILLRREPLGWAIGPGFTWSRKAPLPLVLFGEGCVYRRHLLDRLARDGIKTEIYFDGQSYATVVSAVYSGFGVTALAQSQIAAGNLVRVDRLDEVALPDLGTVEVVARCHAPPLNLAVEAFMKEIEIQMRSRPDHYRGPGDGDR